jgi:L-asparaginase II
MVLFAKASGWPIESYWHPDHPVQQLALQAISAVSDVSPSDIATAVDGCGVVCFGMPLRGLATAFARLADPSSVPDQPLSQALYRIRDAMMSHPELVAGERRRLDTILMRAYPRRIVSKGGAEGVISMGLPPGALPAGAPFGEEPMGMAAKSDDGDLGRRAGDVVGVALLKQVGMASEPLPAALAEIAEPPLTDPRGDVSGVVRPAFALS